MNIRSKLNLKTLILLAFGLSGMAALIYEVVWIRPLQLILGSSVYAMSTVLTSIMIGFALGSFIIRHKVDRSENPLRLFYLIEFGIGLYGVIIIPLFGMLSNISVWLQGIPLLQFILIFIVLVIPTTLIGMTWPVVNKICVGRESVGEEEIGKEIGILYSANSLGAAVGSFAAGFMLIPLLGIMNTSFFAAFINILAACAIFVYVRKIRGLK